MLRRRKFQMKPNMATSSSQPSAQGSVVTDSQEDTPQQQDIPVESSASINESTQNDTPLCSEILSLARPPLVERVEAQMSVPQPIVNSLPPPRLPSRVPSPVKTPHLPNILLPEPISNSSVQLLSSLQQSERFKKIDNSDSKVECDFDSKLFKMSDLIKWKPKTENTLKKKWNERKQKLAKSITSEGDMEVGEPQPSEEPKNSSATIGPRVKIGENGEMIIDEESLVIINNPESRAQNLVTINDDLVPKKLNSMSFRKRPLRSSQWSVKETDLFYEVLAATGTDFGLMHEFIPHRSRAELKRKYNKEEKLDVERINEVLSRPTLLDDRLKQRVENMLRAMEEGDDSD